MIKTDDIQSLSERIAGFLYKVPHYPVPEEGTRNPEFQKSMAKGFFDCYKLLLCARQDVFDDVTKNLPLTDDKEVVQAYWKGFMSVLFDPERWLLEPGWDDRANQL